MDLDLQNEIFQLNPWLKSPDFPIIENDLLPRVQFKELIDGEWDKMWLILIGPRRAGKTTLGKILSQEFIRQGRYKELLYLNCDYSSIRKWLKSPLFITEAIKTFSLKKPILFIDEVQRIENPGLLLKAIIDLGLPIKLIATGSSQLEIKSKVQEHLTGRQLSSLILPLSHEEIPWKEAFEETAIFGSYPQVFCSKRKEIQLQEIYNRYIQKYIIEILKVGNPDIFQTLLTLIAHSSGQLVNYQRLSTDCRVSVTMIQNHLNILEQTFVLAKVTPFVGNKRTEITSNPIYYFIDNGFRNMALRNFMPPSSRTDVGLLIESLVFQELYKFRSQHFLNFDLHFWRTKSGAEVDFVLYKNSESLLPIEVKYQRFTKPTITKGFRSFLSAYHPTDAVIITKDFIANLEVEGCYVHFIPLAQIEKAFALIKAL
jgi:hypothetical protein